MAVKLDKKTRWLAVRNFIDSQHGIKVNFSDKHENYFTAYTYVVKEDADYVLSENHPDLANATARPPRTTNATQKHKTNSKKRVASKKKRKRLAVYDVVRIIQSKGIKSRVELMALASKWQEQGKTDMAEFVSCNRGPRVVNEALETAHELTQAEKRLERISKTRLELLQEQLTQPCQDNCDGLWLRAAIQILDGNGIPVLTFASAVYDALLRGRGKYRNIYIHGPANCGKTFLISPLKSIYECFVNPASGSFAWVGIEEAEVVLLNDLRWKPSLIPWCEFLQVLEGDTVHFPAPKNFVRKDIVLEKDTPFFATSDAPLALVMGGSVDRVNTEMMDVRWRMFKLHRQIPRDEQKHIKPCGSSLLCQAYLR